MFLAVVEKAIAALFTPMLLCSPMNLVFWSQFCIYAIKKHGPINIHAYCVTSVLMYVIL
jgi:hypothetical protein